MDIYDQNLWNAKVESIMDNIEEIRKRNNVNWCNILRIALKSQPEEVKKLIASINNLDKKVSKELEKLL